MRLLSIFILFCGCHPPPAEKFHPDQFQPSQMRIHLIDVGQGAATLLEFSCGAVLVDTGGEKNDQWNGEHAFTAYLDRFFAYRPDLQRTLELVVLTHPHIDHTLSADALSPYRVKNVITNGGTKGSGAHQQIALQNWAAAHAHFEAIDASTIPPGGSSDAVIDPIYCQDIDPKLSVLWGTLSKRPAGWSKDDFEDPNNHSVVLRVDFGKASFLVSGDLEEDGIRELIAKHKGTHALDVDVWQVSHHGSYNGTTDPLLAQLTPQIALLGFGPPTRKLQWTAWDYGHPRKVAIDLLAGKIARQRPPRDVQVATAQEKFVPYRLTKAIFATGWDGSVIVTAKSDGTYRVQTER